MKSSQHGNGLSAEGNRYVSNNSKSAKTSAVKDGKLVNGLRYSKDSKAVNPNLESLDKYEGLRIKNNRCSTALELSKRSITGPLQPKILNKPAILTD